MTLKYFNDLAYEEMGENNDEIILFLHTKLLDKWIWKKQKENYHKYFNEYHCIFLISNLRITNRGGIVLKAP